MLRTPSRRFTRRPAPGLNLIPILDAVFIFIFFLLMSTNFIQIFEISSDAPIVSDAPPKDSDKEPLMLSLRIEKDQLVLSKGIDQTRIELFKKGTDGKFPLEKLHLKLIELKSQNLDEKQIILEPAFDIVYDDLVLIMDSVRMLRNTDQAIYRKDKKSGEDIKVSSLFDQILFGNIQEDLK